VGQGLAQPPAPLGTWRQGVAGEVQVVVQVQWQAVENSAMTFSTILLILALVAFVLAAIGLSYKKTDLIAIGLALWSLSVLIGRLSGNFTISTIVLLLAFIAFVAAAIGWRYKKIGLIAVGLALWMLSLVLPSLHVA
jgi:hypothetical protein